MTDEESLDYLKKTYPSILSQAKSNRDEYFSKVMGNVKTYWRKKNSLVFKRSQENLFIFGFYCEACVVSRVVLEDAIRRKYNPSSKKTLETIIDECLIGKTKDLAHKIRKNGNNFAHENWRRRQPLFPEKDEKEKAMKSAKALNQVLVDLGYKEPEFFQG
ncbi:MAG: DUF4145 domain-containing protein [Candidatus Diapherotrites archaeon]|nr:DUF4145 domain-containing protein [Candidatus Diapherotrites archaeon]